MQRTATQRETVFLDNVVYIFLAVCVAIILFLSLCDA